jgi:hypothetical protein
MKKLVTWVMVSAVAIAASAQSTETAKSQTARQALLEMFFSKTPGTFLKHVPTATITALATSTAFTQMQSYSTLAGQLQSKGKGFETFETGSVLLSGENPQTGEKFEVLVNDDSLQGDEDKITISFRSYKEKQPKRTPYMPNMTFGMKMEDGVWKLNEILFTLRLPLTDPDFLRGVTEALKPKPNLMATGQITGGQMMNGKITMTGQMQSQPSITNFGANTGATNATVLSALRKILAAETTYSAMYRSVGYTCTLSDLDGFGGGEPNEHQAMLIGSDLASGRRYGYAFALSGCTGSPAAGFELTAAPAGNSFGRRAYCADQTGAIRYSADGNAATCLASGTPVE